MSERAPKRARTERRQGQSVLLTDRDFDLLVLVGLSGYLSTEQAARDLFPSVNRCRRRVRELYDAGLLTVTLLDSRSANLLSLSAKGVEVVAERAAALASRLRRPGPIRLAGVPHHLALVDVRLYAAALGARRGLPLLAWESGAGELARELGLPAWHLEPDGLAVFAGTRGSRYVAVEVDCGTEPVGSVLGGKLDRGYVPLAAAGTLDALWIVLAGAGCRRERSVRGLLDAAGLGAFGCVLSQEYVVARPARELSGEGGAAGALAGGGAGMGPKAPNTVLVHPSLAQGVRGV